MYFLKKCIVTYVILLQGFNLAHFWKMCMESIYCTFVFHLAFKNMSFITSQNIIKNIYLKAKWNIKVKGIKMCWFFVILCTLKACVNPFTWSRIAIYFIRGENEQLPMSVKFATRAEGECCNHTKRQSLVPHEWNTLFFPTRLVTIEGLDAIRALTLETAWKWRPDYTNEQSTGNDFKKIPSHSLQKAETFMYVLFLRTLFISWDKK